MSFPWSTDQTAAVGRLQSGYNENAYDAGTNLLGLGQGGHVQNFIPAIRDVATGAQAAGDAANAASTSATSAATSSTSAAASAAKLSGTSTTSVTIGSGSKSFTTQTGKFFDPGVSVLVTSDSNPTVLWMRGTVTTYSSGSLTVDVPTSGYSGSGTYTDWTIRIDGKQGQTGLNGDKGWAPVLAVVTDSARRVLQVIDWTGGVGTKPATGDYVGASGLTATLASAVDIRGASSVGSGNVNPTGAGFAAGRFALFADGTGNVIQDGGLKHAVAVSGDFNDLSNKPTATSLLDVLSSTRGTLTYRGASAWAGLTPGATGYLLRSNGAGADPSYDSLSNITDIISSTRGTVLYRGASAWSALAPGTSGQLLQTGGAGADPSWATLLVFQHGQCQLSKSGSNLILLPKNGNRLTINGVACTVPDGGVTLAPGALAVGTTYNIYATASAGTVNAIEASTTAHATSTTTNNKGIEIKSGDDTRTLVGMARTIAGPAWADTATQRFVRSWFNDNGVSSFLSWNTTQPSLDSAVNTTYNELSTALRIEALLWAGETWDVSFSGMTSNTSATWNATAIGIDGANPPELAVTATSLSAGGYGCATVRAVKAGLSEGYHYATTVGKVAAGVGTWSLGISHPSAIMGRTVR